MKFKQPLDSREHIPSKPITKSPMLWGGIVLVIFFGVFATWSFVFPLETAAVAQGSIVVDSNVKTIQHLEGGIIKAIKVQDGQHVEKGQVLLILEETQAKAEATSSYNEYLELLAKEARLVAEQNEADKVTIPKQVLENKNKENIRKTISGQKDIFKDNKFAFEKLIKSLDEKIVHLNTQIADLTKQVEAEKERLGYVNKEIEASTKLLKQNYVGQSEIWQLNRQASLVKSAMNEYKAEIAQTKQQLAQTELQKVTEFNNRRKEILTELRKTQRELALAKERYTSSKDVMVRRVIYAPISGTVVNLSFHTVGGVIRNGDPIMDIVPKGDKLVIKASLSPNDIDIVHKGMPAKVQLTAYLARRTPTVTGTVTRVSADAIQNQQTGEMFYEIRVTIDPNQLSKLKKIKLYPGMPAQVMVIVDKRSFFDYLVTPLTSSFERAFKEE